MLPPFIIEQLRQREEEERRHEERPVLELPLSGQPPMHRSDSEEPGRGICEIQIWD